MDNSTVLVKHAFVPSYLLAGASHVIDLGRYGVEFRELHGRLRVEFMYGGRFDQNVQFQAEIEFHKHGNPGATVEKVVVPVTDGVQFHPASGGWNRFYTVIAVPAEGMTWQYLDGKERTRLFGQENTEQSLALSAFVSRFPRIFEE
ncbi:hypothetical protein HK100_012311 [Physocladia obscura]|uniref:Uncharacterized protein n=1 Tax=Physocladia obscura TaxID=109957 RepID=A0AAD5T981_9FUNG|nr:hypothetical protein HK100_012311 [Physocladia obscura]